MTQLTYSARWCSGTAQPEINERTTLASFMHEINNPLESLLSLLYLLESETTLSRQGREHLVLACGEVRRIASIAHAALNDVRDQPHPQDADIPALLGSVLELYSPRMASRGITVLSRYCRDGSVKADSGLLRQMFSNLLLNAADAMPNGGTVNVRCASCHEWNDRKRPGIRVTFADNGCGIAAHDLSRIMEPFFSTKGSDGNGMGLSVVKEVVRKHRGVLRVRSSTKAGRSGSIFSVFLPACSN